MLIGLSMVFMFGAGFLFSIASYQRDMATTILTGFITLLGLLFGISSYFF